MEKGTLASPGPRPIVGRRLSLLPHPYRLPPNPFDGALDRRVLRALGTWRGVALTGAGGACDVREYARAHGAKLRLSIATGPIGGTYYVYGGGLASVISRHIPNVEATAELTSASVDNLKFLRMGRADLALVVATSLYEAYRAPSPSRPRRCRAHAGRAVHQPMHFSPRQS